MWEGQAVFSVVPDICKNSGTGEKLLQNIHGLGCLYRRYWRGRRHAFALYADIPGISQRSLLRQERRFQAV
jgi:hypothetical protein